MPIKVLHIIFLTIIFIPATATARPLAEQSGWGIDFALTFGFTQSQSQFNGDSDNETTPDLFNRGKRISQAVVLPLGRVDYTLDSLKTQFFLGNSRENVSKGQFQIELGVTHQFENETRLTLAYFPELPFLGDTWQDPYLTGQPRQKTDEQAQGGRIALENIAGTSLNLKYTFALNRIDEEHGGDSLNFLSEEERLLLHRDTDLQRVTVEYLFPLSKQFFIKPGLLYTRSDAKGKANSWDEYALQIQGIYNHERHRLIGTAFYGHLKAKIDHPVFNTRQKNDRYSLFALYSYREPFDWKNTSLLGLAFWGKTDSTITFYEKDGFGITLGMGYQWR